MKPQEVLFKRRAFRFRLQELAARLTHRQGGKKATYLLKAPGNGRFPGVFLPLPARAYRHSGPLADILLASLITPFWMSTYGWD